MADTNNPRPFDLVLIKGGMPDPDEVFDQDATIPYVALRTEDGSVIEPVDRHYTPNRIGLPLETVSEPSSNMYEQTSAIMRRALFGQQERPVLDQALSFLTYGDCDSALETIRDFHERFIRRFGALT